MTKKRILKKAVSLALTLCMAVAMLAGLGLALPLGVRAADESIVIDTVDASGTGYTFTSDSAGDVVTIIENGTYTITQANSGTATTNRIVVTGGLTVTLAIDGLNIVAPDVADGAPAIALGAGSNVALQLSGSNALTGTRAYAGIQTSDATLTISGSGSLTATGGLGWGNAAGIGGNSQEMGAVGNGGTIIVNSGTITTQRLGSGGNGGDDANGGNGGHVTINGGTIKGVNTQLRIASGGSSSNGYAGGTGGTVIINGGFIDNINDATIGEGGASGTGGTGGNVTINGGTVIVYAIARGGRGSGSGVCNGGNGGTVVITGGSVNATNVAAGGTGGGSGSTDGTAGTITNGTNPVYLTTLTLDGVLAETAVASITAPSGYGVTDVKTDSTGKLYFWLPESASTAVTLTAGSNVYSNSAVTVANTNASTATLTAEVPAPTITSLSPSSGGEGGGTNVTLTGTNLTGATAVTVGGNAATSVNVVNATTITFTTPTGTAGPADVAVTTPGGTATLANGFTYIPAPTIITVFPNQGPETGGTTVTLTGTNLTGATAVTVGGVNAASFTVVNDTTITLVTPPGTVGAANVSVTTPGGTATLANIFGYLLDTTAPTLTAGTSTRTSDTAATVTFTSDEAGTYFYLVQDTATGAPTTAAVKAANNSATMTAGENTITNPTGLVAGALKIYIVAEDNASTPNLTSTVLEMAIPPDHTATQTPGTIGEGTDAVFTFNGEYADLAGVTLKHQNGTTYTFALTASGNQTNLTHGGNSAGKAESSSVKVTLYAAWLDTLPAGTYTLTVNFDDNVVQSSGSAGFTLTRANSGGGTTADPTPTGGSPQTGDSSNIPLLALIGSAALAGLGLCLYGLRKRLGRKAG